MAGTPSQRAKNAESVSMSWHHRVYCKLNRETNRPWWRHQMETFSALLALCAGNSPVPGEFPTLRPVTPRFDVFFWRPLWRHCNAIVDSLNCKSGDLEGNLCRICTNIHAFMLLEFFAHFIPTDHVVPSQWKCMCLCPWKSYADSSQRKGACRVSLQKTTFRKPNQLRCTQQMLNERIN